MVFESMLKELPSRESSADSRSSAPARSEKEFELQVKMFPRQDETEGLVGLGTASLTAKAVGVDRTCDLCSLERNVEARSLSEIGTAASTLVSE